MEFTYYTTTNLPVLFTELKNNSNYPKFNIIELDEDTQRLDLALAGWKKNEIIVTVRENELSISGKKEPEEKEVNYITHNIAYRDFVFERTLNKYWKVKDVTMTDGILSLTVKREIPEEAKPKTFEIK